MTHLTREMLLLTVLRRLCALLPQNLSPISRGRSPCLRLNFEHENAAIGLCTQMGTSQE